MKASVTLSSIEILIIEILHIRIIKRLLQCQCYKFKSKAKLILEIQKNWKIKILYHR